ncbi:MAG: TetR/AcrR family transcriptional regulator [Spirochaetaceae bacterium]|nr:TetR/AcrR family transcriptional regulator [Spirochaetaceae bacterium]
MESLTIKQNEIVKASIKLISEGGIQHFTMKSLAELLGVTEPAIYRHFSSKMDILFSMLLMIDETNKQFKIEIEETTPSLNLLKKMFINHSKIFIENPEISSIIFSEEIFQNNKKLSDKILHIMKERKNLTCKVIEDIQKSGEIRDDISAKKLTLIILGSLRLTISNWKYSGFTFDLEKELDETWSAICCLIKK